MEVTTYSELYSEKYNRVLFVILDDIIYGVSKDLKKNVYKDKIYFAGEDKLLNHLIDKDEKKLFKRDIQDFPHKYIPKILKAVNEHTPSKKEEIVLDKVEILSELEKGLVFEEWFNFNK